jgi:hypothetical protein
MRVRALPPDEMFLALAVGGISLLVGIIALGL